MIEPSREIALLILFACCIIIGLTGSTLAKKYMVCTNEQQTLIVRKKRKKQEGLSGIGNEGKIVGERKGLRSEKETGSVLDDESRIKVIPYGCQFVFPSRHDHVLLDHKTHTFELTIRDIPTIGGERIDMDVSFSYSVDRELVLDRKIAKLFLDQTRDEIDSAALHEIERVLRERCSELPLKDMEKNWIRISYIIKDSGKVSFASTGLRIIDFSIRSVRYAEDQFDAGSHLEKIDDNGNEPLY